MGNTASSPIKLRTISLICTFDLPTDAVLIGQLSGPVSMYRKSDSGARSCRQVRVTLHGLGRSSPWHTAPVHHEAGCERAPVSRHNCPRSHAAIDVSFLSTACNPAAVARSTASSVRPSITIS